jgi:hypothetical protein
MALAIAAAPDASAQAGAREASVAPSPALRAEDVRVGSIEERYLRTLSLLAPTDRTEWSVRPLSLAAATKALRAVDGPWAIDTTTASAPPWRLREYGGDVTWNSAFPTARGDGAAWTGRGLNARAFAATAWSRGRWSARLGPMLWWSANDAFRLNATATGWPYVDGLRPETIDLPQRFGDGYVARLEPAESFVAVEAAALRLEFTTAAARIGAGGEHALVLQGDGGGYPRVELGTARRLTTPIGDVTGRVSWGRSPQSGFSPERRTGALLTGYLVGTLRPRGVPALEVGMIRLTSVDWMGVTAHELLVPFGSVYKDASAVFERPDNQIASVFARLRVPAAGLEFFGEYGKNDRAASLRDYVVEAEHAAAWLVGMQRAWRDGRGRLWGAQATAIGGAIAPITAFRFESTFYDHFPLAQGHTVRGQLLGSPLLEREGGLEVRVDRYDDSGYAAVVVATRGLTNQYAPAVAPENLRQEWSLMFERLRWTRAGAWRARAGLVADLNRWDGGEDGLGVHLSLGLMRR